MHWKSVAVTAALAATVVAVPTVASASAPPDPTSEAAPQGFAPSSASWLTNDHGIVLGYGTDASRPALLETWNGGRTWQRIGAPSVPLPDTHAVVSVSFSNLLFGVVNDGQNAYSTIDHGTHWHKLSIVDAPEGRVRIVKTVAYGGRFFAVVSGATETGEGNSVGLYSASIWSHELRPVKGMSFAGSTGGDLTTKGGLAVTLGGEAGFEAKYWTSSDGSRFRPGSSPCEDSFVPALAGRVQGRSYALCTGDSGWSKSTKSLSATDSDGAFGQVGEQAPRDGFSAGVAVASSSTGIVAAAAGDEVWLYGTFDGGRTWSTVLQNGPDRPVSDLSFSSAKIGSVVIGQPDWGPAELLRTTDGGHTWTPLHF